MREVITLASQAKEKGRVIPVFFLTRQSEEGRSGDIIFINQG